MGILISCRARKGNTAYGTGIMTDGAGHADIPVKPGFFPFRPFYSDTGYAERIVDALLRADSAAGAAFDTDHLINDMKHLLFSPDGLHGTDLDTGPATIAGFYDFIRHDFPPRSIYCPLIPRRATRASVGLPVAASHPN